MWKPGQSGNPAGRKKGMRRRITVAAERLMEDDAENVVRSVLAAARDGDMAAAKLVLERIVPLRRGRPVEVALPPIQSPADLTAATAAVVAAVGSGELTPEEGQAVGALLEAHTRALETAELERRVAALEEAHGRR